MSCVRSRWLIDVGSITWGQGSSEGNGYRQDLRDLLSPTEVTYIGTQCSGHMQNGNNEGHRNYRIDQLEAVLAPNVALQPNVVLVYAGTNDMLSQQADAAPGDMQHLVRYLVAHLPNALVVVSKLFTDAHPQIAKRIEVFDSELEVTQLGNVVIADMSNLLKVAELGPDGEHPKDPGYAKMAQVFFNVLVKAESEGRIASLVHVRYTLMCNGPPVLPTTSSTSQPTAASKASEPTSLATGSFTTSDAHSSSNSPSTSQTPLTSSSTLLSLLTSPASTGPLTSQSPTNSAQKLVSTSNAGISIFVSLAWLGFVL